MSITGTSSLRSCYQYIPDFVTEEEEQYLLRKIEESPSQKWKSVKKRRLQIWGGEIAPNNTLISQPLPTFLTTYPNLVERLSATGVFENSAHKTPNHVIINEYQPGEGIMPHEDGPAYHPVVATISLGSHTVFHYLRYKPEASADGSSSGANQGDAMGSEGAHGRIIDQEPVLSLLLEPRSVIITTGALYKDHLHFIDDVTEDWVQFGDPSIDLATSKSSQDQSQGQPNHMENEEEPVKVQVDNWNLLHEETRQHIVHNRGKIARSTRVSLTCRDVERVRKIGVFGGR
ncbi:hypothetical protein FS842_008551 [Serendipita sp. 407]|nr:hypothetical protein FRC15_005370 [Serendipita sp. 397]KAG8867437.1 hypothetical protein FRC20_005755 [Serendipita sp. 405]KAG9053180.1 hypothetical protein FS842_008551 [Serendipita sp. 407]